MPCVAELVDGQVERPLDAGQLRAAVVAAEQVVGERAAAAEHLVGQLAAQHPPVGDALAGRRLRQRVERCDAAGEKVNR